MGEYTDHSTNRQWAEDVSPLCDVREYEMGERMESGAGWKWYGFPGHFIGGRNCAFHLCTVVNGYLISTLGAYRPSGSDETETIGIGRYYETMVFTCPGDDDNGDPIMGDEVDMRGYNESIEAERGHYRVCWEYAERGDSHE